MKRTSRRDFLSGSVLTVAGGVLGSRAIARAWQQTPPPAGPPAAGAPSPPAPVTPVFTPLRRNVGFFTGRGGTIGYLISPAGLIVIDSQFPDTAKLCLDGLNERSGSRPVDVLINTHHHGDHTGGNIVFKGVAKKVVAHAKAAEHMKQPPGRPAPTGENLYPTETFTETWRVAIGDEVVRAKFYGQAHTSGDVVITFERANVVHMGDLMFNRRQLVVDRPAGATLRNWISVIEKAAADQPADAMYIFGHSGTNVPVTGARPDLMTMRDYLTALIGFVQSEIKSGKPKDQIVAQTGTLKGFESHGEFSAAVLTAAYDELIGA
jgi:cyclase